MEPSASHEVSMVLAAPVVPICFPRFTLSAGKRIGLGGGERGNTPAL